MAALDQMFQSLAHATQLGDLAVHLGQVPFGQRLHLSALPLPVAPQCQKIGDIGDRKAEAARALNLKVSTSRSS